MSPRRDRGRTAARVAGQHTEIERRVPLLALDDEARLREATPDPLHPADRLYDERLEVRDDDADEAGLVFGDSRAARALDLGAHGALDPGGEGGQLVTLAGPGDQRRQRLAVVVREPPDVDGHE